MLIPMSQNKAESPIVLRGATMTASNKTTLLKTILLTSAGLLVSAPAFAQLSGDKEIIVTATKRSESIQDVPLSIEAVTGATIEDFGVESLTDLSSLVPNFTVGEGITTTTISMRGLGSGAERSFEQAVGMFIDGQYMPRSRQYRSPFFDVERVEVVKGPQAVYFGLNSTAGAVSVVSRKTKPGDAANGYLSAEYDFDYGGPSIEGAAGFSTDRAGMRFAARVGNKDGYFINTLTGEEENDVEDILIRANFIYDLSENVTLRAKVEHSDFKSNGHIGEIYGLASAFIEVPAVLGETDGELNWRRSSNGENIAFPGAFPNNTPGTDSQSTNIQFAADFETSNGGTVTAQFSNSKFDYDLVTDLDTTYLSVLDAAIVEDYEQSAAELRYTSPDDGQLRYMVGGYYHDTSLANAQPNIYGTQAGVPGSLLDGGNILISEGQFALDTSLWSLFGVVDFNVSDRMKVSVGARYTDETKDVLRDSRCLAGNTATSSSAPASLAAILAGAGLCPALDLNGFTDSRSSNNIMPEAKISFDVSDNIMLYGNVGNSAKAGGFASATNARAATLEYDDESVVGGEIGFKSTWAGGRAKLNAAVFRSDFKDLQVNSFLVNNGVTEAVIANAAEATSQGIEVDGSFDIVDWFTVGGSFALLDAEFDSFTAAPCNRQLTPTPGGTSCDLTGMKLPFAADYSGNVFADFSLPVSDGVSIEGGAIYSFSDEYFTDGTLDATAVQGKWERLNAHIGVNFDNNYKLEVIASNLTDEKVLGSTQPFGGSYNLGYLDPPKMVMVKATVGFGN